MITRVLAQCSRSGEVNRSTPPKISSWIAKFNGEIVGIDVVYPFAGSRAHKAFPKIFGLATAFCLTKLCARPAIHDIAEKTTSTAFMNDLVRFFWGTRRIILDAGSPGQIGPECDRLPNAFFWKMIAGPPRAPDQNGVMWRSFRNLKISAHSIMTDPSMIPGKELITLAIISRNHLPRPATGVHPALAITGRVDLLAGAASTIFDHDPVSDDIAIHQQYGMRNILNARNDAIAASARQALKTCIGRHPPYRSRAFYPIGSSVQIADRGQWLGSYRVIAHASSNRILEKGTQPSKWPKTKRMRHIWAMRRSNGRDLGY